jgi:hypothetical protein
MTGHGAYPDANNDDNGVTAFSTSLAQRQARYGANSVMVLPLLFRATQPGMVNFSDPDSRKQASADVDRVAAILEQNNAPASLVLMWKVMSASMAVAAQIKTEAQGEAEVQGILLAAARDPALSLDTVYLATISTTQTPNMPTNFKAAMLSATLDLLNRKAAAGDPRTVAIALRLYGLRISTGDENGAANALKGVQVPQDACYLANPAPHYVSSNITSDDYPGDLIFATMPGLSDAEFDLNASGGATNGRLLLEDPPYAFNDIAMARIPTIHYDPAHFHGAISACRAAIQPIRWQVPDAPYGM